MKYMIIPANPIGETTNQIVIHKKNIIMTNPALSLLTRKRNNSYLYHFELALHNLQLWQEEQREKRIQKHRKKQIQ